MLGNLQRTALSLSAAALLVSALTGCMKGKAHQEWVKQSDDRWHQARAQLMLPMAQQAFDTGDLDEAQRVVHEALIMDENNAQFFLLNGRIALERNKLERAYHLFAKAIELDDKYPAAHYFQGIIYQRWSRDEDALTAYQKSYELKADSVDYLLAVCEMLVELDRSDEAITLLQSKLDYFDQNVGVRTALGYLHLMGGDYPRAVRHFKEASLLDPDNLKIREELSLSLYAAGNTREASRTLATLLEESQMSLRYDLHAVLARCHTQEDRPDDARRLYLELTRKEPRHAGHWIALGELSWQMQDLPATLTAARRAIRLDPQNHQGYLLAGMAFQKQNRLDDALRSFDRAAELAPDDAIPLILRGVALQRNGQTAAAAQAYTQALQRQPHDPRAMRLLQSIVPTPHE